MTPKLEKLEELVFTSCSSFSSFGVIENSSTTLFLLVFPTFPLFCEPMVWTARAPADRVVKKLEKLENTICWMNFQ